MGDLSTVAIQQFNDSFINQYDANMVLGGGRTTQIIHGALGSSYKWPIQGSITMQKRGGYGSLVPLVQPDYERIITTFDDYAVGVPVDEHEQALLNIDVVGTLPKKLAMSTGRMVDQIIIDALVAASVPAENSIAAGSTNLTLDKIRAVAAAFKKNNVPENDRFLLITGDQRDSLLSDDKVLNTLYVNNRNLLTGQIDMLLGFNIICIGDREEGGLPIDSSSVRTCLAWQKDSMGYVESIAPRTQLDYQSRSLSHQATADFRSGASNLLPKGVAKIFCAE